jgi:S1-C subfamily serine protease
MLGFGKKKKDPKVEYMDNSNVPLDPNQRQSYSDYSSDNSANFQSQYNSYPESYNSQNSQTPNSQRKLPGKTKKQGGVLSSISRFFRNIGILLVLTVLLISTIIAYVIIDPESDISQFIVKNTPLNEYISINDQEERTRQNEPGNQSQEDSKIINKTFGLDTQDEGFSFADPEDGKQVVSVVEEVLPSVVSISLKTSDVIEVDNQIVAGTGFIAREDGLVVTNRHVVAKKCEPGNDSIIITASGNGREVFELELLSVDPIYDIAILQIKNPPDNLQALKISDSDELRLGTEVIAIGNALGELRNTVTKGIVSGLNRNIKSDLEDQCTGNSVIAEGLIQTDAAINKGNSGGPLFNASGHLVGMNTFSTQEGQNIGLAIPSDIIISALNSYKEEGQVVRPRLGIFSRPITSVLKSQWTWLPRDYGEIILAPSGEQAIESGSAAQEAGLQEGDIILEIDGEKVELETEDSISPLRNKLLEKKPGQNVTMSILRVREKTSQNYTYFEEPVEIQVELGRAVFDLE